LSVKAGSAIKFMADGEQVVSLAQWLQTPAGHDLLAWEQCQLDAAVADVFGFHALQLGLPQVQALRANRMPHRWLAVDQMLRAGACSFLDYPSMVQPSLVCDFDALPLDSQSLDLIIVPHALELARDPHRALGEIDRVLRPEGCAVILGFNPASLWGLRQRLGQLRRSVGLGRGRPLFMPRAGEFIGYRRLRDWLRLLSFDVVQARFGCYRPPFNSAAWLQRSAWMDNVGQRWWPVFGAVYMLVAVKRVRGVRLVGLTRQSSTRKQTVPAAVVHSNFHYPQEET
jgi:SAM-dependent methyltransferase